MRHFALARSALRFARPPERPGFPAGTDPSRPLFPFRPATRGSAAPVAVGFASEERKMGYPGDDRSGGGDRWQGREPYRGGGRGEGRGGYGGGVEGGGASRIGAVAVSRAAAAMAAAAAIAATTIAASSTARATSSAPGSATTRRSAAARPTSGAGSRSKG